MPRAQHFSLYERGQQCHLSSRNSPRSNKCWQTCQQSLSGGTNLPLHLLTPGILEILTLYPNAGQLQRFFQSILAEALRNCALLGRLQCTSSLSNDQRNTITFAVAPTCEAGITAMHAQKSALRRLEPSGRVTWQASSSTAPGHAS